MFPFHFSFYKNTKLNSIEQMISPWKGSQVNNNEANWVHVKANKIKIHFRPHCQKLSGSIQNHAIRALVIQLLQHHHTVVARAVEDQDYMQQLGILCYHHRLQHHLPHPLATECLHHPVVHWTPQIQWEVGFMNHIDE